MTAGGGRSGTPAPERRAVQGGEGRDPLRIAPGTSVVDLLHQGSPGVIGTGVLETEDGVALVDPGPEACLGALRDGLAALGCALDDVRAVLLTHIHLDHATAAGAIARAVPEAVVHVHSAGARHMIDPARLLASAERLYGDAMATLWGEFVPVPAASVREVAEGDEIVLGGRRLQVAYVPGHAKHHVAYYEAAAKTAWPGDVGGIRIGGGPAMPVTPPPDIDSALWIASMHRVLDWRPERIVPTHFGAYEDPRSHFAQLETELERWTASVRASLADPSTDPDAAAAAFAREVRDRLEAAAGPGLAARYAIASSFEDSWRGLARYLRKAGNPNGGAA